MANITKAQAKNKIELFIERLSDLRLEFEDLKEVLEMELSDIEPYEERCELTELQQERQKWLENTSLTLDYTTNFLQEAEDNLQYIE